MQWKAYLWNFEPISLLKILMVKMKSCCLFSYIYATKTDVHFEIVGDVSHKELIVIVRKVIDR